MIGPIFRTLTFTRQLSVTNCCNEFNGNPTDGLVSDTTLQTDVPTFAPRKALFTPQRMPYSLSFESVTAMSMKIAVFDVIRRVLSYRRRFGVTYCSHIQGRGIII